MTEHEYREYRVVAIVHVGTGRFRRLVSDWGTGHETVVGVFELLEGIDGVDVTVQSRVVEGYADPAEVPQ